LAGKIAQIKNPVQLGGEVETDKVSSQRIAAEVVCQFLKFLDYSKSQRKIMIERLK
jgi:hypothetical protein